MIKVIICLLSVFCLLLTFCDENSSVGPSDPNKKDTSIFIGTWAQKFDTSTIEKKEYWRSGPGTFTFSEPDTTYFLNDSVEMRYYIDQTGKRYKDSTFYYYRHDTLWEYTKDEFNTGINIKGDTSWVLFKIVGDTLFTGKIKDTIGCYFKM